MTPGTLSLETTTFWLFTGYGGKMATELRQVRFYLLVYLFIEVRSPAVQPGLELG